MAWFSPSRYTFCLGLPSVFFARIVTLVIIVMYWTSAHASLRVNFTLMSVSHPPCFWLLFGKFSTLMSLVLETWICRVGWKGRHVNSVSCRQATCRLTWLPFVLWSAIVTIIWITTIILNGRVTPVSLATMLLTRMFHASRGLGRSSPSISTCFLCHWCKKCEVLVLGLLLLTASFDSFFEHGAARVLSTNPLFVQVLAMLRVSFRTHF